MIRTFFSVLCVLSLTSSPLFAQDRDFAGFGMLLTNDVFGDTRDRWRTGSIASSYMWSRDGAAGLPTSFGALLELRVGGEIIAPENLATPAAGDRNFAGVLSVGLHTHFQPSAVEYSVGADLVLTGPSTQLDHVQSSLHDVLGGRDPSAAVQANQVGDDINPTVVVEAAQTYSLGGAARVRPFIEGRAGVETMLRLGADLTIGPAGVDGVSARAPVTGFRYGVVEGGQSGFSFLLGADLASVADSEFLSSSQGLTPEDIRTRVRAGAHWRAPGGSTIFYGVTWLGKEFKTQREEQVVGSVQLRLRFEQFPIPGASQGDSFLLSTS